MKKLLCSLLLIGIVIFAVSCGGKETTKTTSDSKTVVTITRWASNMEEKDFNEWVKVYEDANPKVDIVLNVLPYGAYFDKLRSDLLSGRAADIVFINHWAWKPYKTGNVFENLATVQVITAASEKLLDGAKNVFVKGGEVLAVPVGMVARRPVINLEDFEKAAVEAPDMKTSFESKKLTEILINVSMKNANKMGINMDVSDVLLTLTASIGSPIVDTKTNKVMVNNPNGIKAMKEFKDFMTSGYQVPFEQGTSGAYGTCDDAILSGKVITAYTGPWGIRSMDNAGIKMKTLPTIKVQGGKDITLADFNSVAIPRSSKVKDEAYKVVAWMLSNDAQLKLAKFCDLPVTKEALDTVINTWDKDKYQAFGVGSENIYLQPSLSTEFQTLLGGAMTDFVNGKLTAEQFCEKVEKEGNPILEK